MPPMKEKLTIKTFAEQQPELYERIVATAKNEMYKTLMEQFDEIQKVCAGDAELLVESFQMGRTINQTQRVRIVKLKSQISETHRQISDFELLQKDQAI